MREVWDEKIDGLEAWLEESDTAPTIRHCIVASLRSGSPLVRFEDNSAGIARQAAQDQDFIGWHNMLEGRISKLWRQGQRAHYLENRSSRSADRWAQGLVSNLLEITHSMWIRRNEVVHERHENGLLRAEAEELEERVRHEFEQGIESLHDNDKWLLEQGVDHILSLPGHDQQNWLAEILLAREEYADELAYDASHLAD
jgi:hypothetical protein